MIGLKSIGRSFRKRLNIESEFIEFHHLNILDTNGSSMIKSITVIIPVKNAEKTIDRCLKGLFLQTLEPLEVIIVDGHSNDETINIAKNYPIKIVYEDYGTIGGARQIGVNNAKGQYVAFTDADCIPHPNWLENLMREIGNDVVGVGGGTINIGKGLWEESIALALDTFLGSANSIQDRLVKKKKIVGSISGCNCLYLKEDIIRVGGFNTRLSINEDTEINTRLRRIGMILYTPSAIVLHNQKRHLKSFAKRMYLFGYGRGSNRLWDIQIIPPILGAIVFLIMFVSFKFFLFALAIYIVILIVYSLRIFYNTRKAGYLISIPIIYIIEHISYAIGFYMGNLRFACLKLLMFCKGGCYWK